MYVKSRSKNVANKGLVLSSLKGLLIMILVGLVIASIIYFYYTGDIPRILAKINELLTLKLP